MDDKNILDAPEEHKSGLHIPLKVIISAILGFSVNFGTFFSIDFFTDLSVYELDLGVLVFDMEKTTFLAFVSLGLYLFNAYVRFDIQHWFRMMTVSISIIFAALLLTFITVIQPGSFYAFFNNIQPVIFIALVAGGGSSLATQFLIKKQYFIFCIIMISTIGFFSLVDYL